MTGTAPVSPPSSTTKLRPFALRRFRRPVALSVVTTQHTVGAFALSGLGLHVLEQLKVLLQVAGLSLVAIAKSLDTDHQRGHAQAYGGRNRAGWLCRRCQKLSCTVT